MGSIRPNRRPTHTGPGCRKPAGGWSQSSRQPPPATPLALQRRRHRSKTNATSLVEGGPSCGLPISEPGVPLYSPAEHVEMPSSNPTSLRRLSPPRVLCVVSLRVSCCPEASVQLPPDPPAAPQAWSALPTGHSRTQVTLPPRVRSCFQRVNPPSCCFFLFSACRSGHGVVSTKAYKFAPLFRTLPFLHPSASQDSRSLPLHGAVPALLSSARSSHGLRWSLHSFSLSCIRRSKAGKLHITAPHMHVTACLAKQEVDVEVGENCRTLQALKEAVVEALPKLCVEGFDVSVGGRALDNDEGVLSLEESVRLDVSANSRGLSVLALREAGREVSEAGLLAAVKDGDVVLCTLYLDAGVPLDCTDVCGWTPLRHACTYGHLEIARLLLNRSSTAIDEKGGQGDTPLFRACEYRHLEIARLLLDRGSTAIDEKGGGGHTPLFLACLNGHLEIARLLLDRGSTAIDEKGGGGHTPLLVSCCNGHLEIARLLLDRGSTALDEKDGEGDTPLFRACENRHLEIARLLLDRGSTAIDEKNCRGHTPLFRACCNGHLEIARLLLDRGSTAIDEKDGGGHTPLLVSCCNGHLEIARLLLDRDCSVDVEEYKARSRRFPQEVLEFLDHGRGVIESAKRRRICRQESE